MPNASKLIIFTYSYPYGFGEEWKFNEFNVLSKHFEHVILQPYTFGSNKVVQRQLPSNVTLNEPLVSVPLSTFKLVIRGVFNLAPIGFAIDDLVERKLFFQLKHIKFWLNSTLLVRCLASNPYIQQLRKRKNFDTVLYFYWGTGPALIAPLFDVKKFSKVVAKFHGGDLYEERSSGYLPFRKGIFQTLTHALFISEQGLKYATDRYKIKNGHIFRLGVIAQGLSNISRDSSLRIVTCSSVVPVKRLSLLMEALHHVQCPVIWTHIGDGPHLAVLKNAASTLPNHINVSFLGFVSAQNVQSIYTAQPFDLFINISESEGVPVSIMEALSAGIPILATDVGGTKEIVSAKNGRLIHKDVNALELSKEIDSFYKLPLSEKIELRKGAYQVYEEKSNAVKQYTSLASFLLKD